LQAFGQAEIARFAGLSRKRARQLIAAAPRVVAIGNVHLRKQSIWFGHIV
jgi:hypothetical protein